MNLKTFCAIIFSTLFLQTQLFGQKSIVNVNPVTGTANVVIPVYSVSRGEVSMPINLIYNATGVKPKDVENTAGIGWQLQAGGQVSRQLRGLPDDIKQDISGNSRTGWIYRTDVSTTINTFNIANTGNGNCSNESNDLNYINHYFTYDADSEPDLFYVSAPGLSCQLVYDNINQTFRPVAYQDLKIACTYNNSPNNPLNGVITSFTITNNRGIQYTFSVPEFIQQQTVKPSNSTSSGTYFQTTYKQYQNGIQFYDNWYLKSVIDANGNGVILSYTTSPQRISNDPVILYAGAASNGYTSISQYSVKQTVTPQTLSTIQATDNDLTSQVLSFNWITNAYGGANYGTGQSVVSAITGMGKSLQFNYSLVTYNSTYARYFLRSFTDVGCSTPVNYNFTYYGETYSNYNYSTALSDSTSTRNMDYWGYYTSNSTTYSVPSMYVNPSNATYQRYEVWQTGNTGADYTNQLIGLNRLPDPTNVNAGSLQTISYAQGGSTTLTYESNDYFDVPANFVNQGGGLRIKQITDNDNITSTSLTRSYTYLNPVTGKSSGKPLSLPVYGFTTPYTGSATGNDYWNYSTIRSFNDLSIEDHTIMYEYVKETRAGAGNTLYQYYLPATNWDNTAVPDCSGCTTADWSPTIDYVARPTCASYGPVKNDIDTYPFAPNTNYEFERGLPKSVIAYNQSGGIASETDYNYQRTSSPGIITAVKVEDNANPSNQSVKAYAKYVIYYGTGELTSTVTNKTFDTQALNQSHVTSTNYTYGNTLHQLVSQQVVNSDQSILTTKYTYAKDYTVSAGSNANINALYQLQQLNINAPVETYTTVTRSGNSPVVISASLLLYKAFPGTVANLYLPSQQYKLFQPAGGNSFTPFSASGSTIAYDNRYFLTGNFVSYDYTGILQTTDDGNKHVQAVGIDHNSYQPAIIVKNAADNEIAFNDFDSYAPLKNGITFSGPVSSPPASSHTGNSASFSTGQTLSSVLTKNAPSTNYIFSAWINAANGGTLSFTMTPTGGSAISATGSYTPTGGIWKYFEWVIPVSGTGFTLAATTNQNIGIDDIILYPQTAEVTTYAYDPVTHFKTAETNTNGISSYYTNDQWGRLLFAFDQDRNIVKKNTYATPANYTNFSPSVSYTPAGNITVQTQVNFSATNGDACTASGSTYNWDFGDGTTLSTGGASTASHTYTSAGTYAAKVTVSSPYYGTKTSAANSVAVVAVGAAAPVNIVYTNNTVGSGINSITFQGSAGTFTFNTAQLTSGATLPPGTYSISIAPVGNSYMASSGKGYNSIQVVYGSTNSCFPRTGGNITTNASLASGNSISFTMQTTSCSN